MTTADEFVEAINQREERIQALIGYAQDLETLLRERREQEAASAAGESCEVEISDLRHSHGLRAGTLTLR